MAVIHKRDIDEVLQKLSNVANEYGLTRTDRFIGAFIEYFANIYGESINDVYDLDFQTRIDTVRKILQIIQWAVNQYIYHQVLQYLMKIIMK